MCGKPSACFHTASSRNIGFRYSLSVGHGILYNIASKRNGFYHYYSCMQHSFILPVTTFYVYKCDFILYFMLCSTYWCCCCCVIFTYIVFVPTCVLVLVQYLFRISYVTNLALWLQHFNKITDDYKVLS